MNSSAALITPVANALPTVAMLPFGFDEAAPLATRPLWQLVVELLPVKDPETEFYSLRDIAPLLGRVTPAQLSSHAQDLWPRWEGHYRLNYAQAVSLIRRYCQVGRLLHPRPDLEQMVLNQREVKQ